ncbi:MAG: STAS-like domain-containing protein [Deltaproteobacteria bacterium]
MKIISIYNRAGAFAENKDVARDIRMQDILPTLEKKKEITLDFKGVEAVTQSFIHALISDVLRKYGNNCLDYMTFKACNDTVKKIINIVVDYIQEGMESDHERKLR